MFSLTRKVGRQGDLLVDHGDAPLAGVRRSARPVRLAFQLHRPRIGSWAPLRIFMSVLFPAPFSPIRAWTSPAATSSETDESARVAPKALLIPERLSRGTGITSGIRKGRVDDRRLSGVVHVLNGHEAYARVDGWGNLLWRSTATAVITPR